MLGTNGRGFFNGNSAHPFENPTPLSNLLQIVFIFDSGRVDVHVRGDDRRQNLTKSSVDSLIASLTELRALGFEGEPRVNVLKLNLTPDRSH
jgi:K+-transporting ATPase A subunit